MTALHAVQGSVRTGSRQRWWRLRDRRIRVKLTAMIVVPVLAIVALAGVSVAAQMSVATRLTQARALVALGGTAGELAAVLQAERAGAALVFAGDSSAQTLEEYRRRVSATDVVVERFREQRRGVRPISVFAALLQRLDDAVDGLASVRQQVQLLPDAAGSMVVFGYRAVIADLVGYRLALGQIGVRTSTANRLRGGAALSQAAESLALLQVAVIRSVGDAELTPAAQQEIVGADTGLSEALHDFRDLAPAASRSALDATVSGRAVLEAERLHGVVVRAAPGDALRLGTDAAGWALVVGTRIALMHSVERDLDRVLLDEVDGQRDAARRTALVVAGVVVFGLVVTVVIVWWVARSLISSLARLRAGANDIAAVRLPHMVDRLNAGNVEPGGVEDLVAEAVVPIVVHGTDEVAQVAAAFAEVTASAIRTAGQQAALRGAVGAMFVSLSRRLQRRADAMVSSIDELEKDEDDPERLAQLFGLDHGATLIRRLVAGLQVLAGGRAGRPMPHPVSLPDLLRAASSEIEDYKRVDLVEVDGDAHIIGDVAEDLVHLLAELLDNAAKFSPPQSQILITGRRIGDLVYVQVVDSGMGMGGPALDAARERIANPGRLDQHTTQHMGIPVVAAIAGRLDVSVTYRSEPGHGTKVDLAVPAALVTTVHTVPERGDGPAGPGASTRPVVAAIDLPTVHLPVITPRSAAGAPPRAWPPLVTEATAPVRTAHRPRPEAPAVIFDEVTSWFQRSRSGSSVAVTAPDVRQAGTRAAQAAQAVVAASTTRCGLPVRQPGQRVVPVPAEPALPVVPARRDPADMRRQLSAFQHGLGVAGRRTMPVLVEDQS